jgi:hypothetical protein
LPPRGRTDNTPASAINFRKLRRVSAYLRHLNPASFVHGPCPLWRTPLRWLQAGCAGAVVLDPIPAGVILARAPGRLAAEDQSHANQLVDSGAAVPHQIVIPRGDFRNAY